MKGHLWRRSISIVSLLLIGPLCVSSVIADSVSDDRGNRGTASPAQIVGCSHPGIESIVAEAATINPRIRFVAGGFHLVTAQDAAIEKTVTALHDAYKVERIAPGHCSGEHTFAAIKRIFGDRDQYAGVGSVVLLGSVGRVASRAQGHDAQSRLHHPV